MLNKPTLARITGWCRANRFFVFVYAVATLIIFFRLSHVDMTGDDAYYSIRSIGLIDFMFSTQQSTPLLWFDHFPWWANLSFHDHPLLLFIIQHLFLTVQTSTWFAKLPFAFMALGTIALSYAWLKRLYGQKVALVAVILLVLNADFIAVARTTVLESGVLFFLSLALYATVLAREQKKCWWLLGIALGLLVEVKFTTLFFFPALAIYGLLYQRKYFSKKQLGGIVAIIFSLALPVILYNFFMYRATGHMSLQLVRLFHENSPWNFAGAAFDWRSPLRLAQNMSIPFFILFIISLGDAIYQWRGRRLIILIIGFLTLQSVVTGLMSPLYSIFSSPLIALFLVGWFHSWRTQTSSAPIVRASALAGSAYLFFFLVNSLFFTRSFGPVGWAHSLQRNANYGFYQLDKYLDTIVEQDSIARIETYGNIKAKKDSLAVYHLAKTPTIEEIHNFPPIIIFDDDINWSARVWAFDRRSFYENIGVFPTSLVPKLQAGQLAPQSIYFIKASKFALHDTADHGTLASRIEKVAINRGVEPTPIRRDDGKTAFLVYHIPGGPIADLVKVSD